MLFLGGWRIQSEPIYLAALFLITIFLRVQVRTYEVSTQKTTVFIPNIEAL